jgi:hypothetical protein
MAVRGRMPRDKGPLLRLCRLAAEPAGHAGSGRVLGEDLLELGDEPERLIVAALEDVAAEDQAGGAGFHRLAGLLQHGLVAGVLTAGDQ